MPSSPDTKSSSKTAAAVRRIMPAVARRCVALVVLTSGSEAASAQRFKLAMILVVCKGRIGGFAKSFHQSERVVCPRSESQDLTISSSCHAKRSDLGLGLLLRNAPQLIALRSDEPTLVSAGPNPHEQGRPAGLTSCAKHV